jgi:uncharacterized protein (DUF2267 family)
MPDYSHPELVARVRELGPFGDDAEATRVLVAVVGVLAAFLTPEEQLSLRAALPRELSAAFTTGTMHPPPATAAAFFEGVRASEGIRKSLAVEHAEIVCRVLGELFPDALLARLARSLPQIATLFLSREEVEPPLSNEERASDAPNDLAEGRPGGSHPLSSANPDQIAHRHSVARSNDPHAESRLSSARGLTQERQGRTLSTGHPGSRRPISRGH